MHNETNMNLQKYIEKKKYYIQTIENYKKKIDKKTFKEQFVITGRLKIFFNSKKKIKNILFKPHIFLMVVIVKFYIYLKVDYKKKL